MEPTYSVRDHITDGDFLKCTRTRLNDKYGPIDHNMPCALPRPIAGVRNNNTADIVGARADTKRAGAFTYY